MRLLENFADLLKRVIQVCDSNGVDLSSIDEFCTLKITEPQVHLLKICHLTYAFDCAQASKNTNSKGQEHKQDSPENTNCVSKTLLKLTEFLASR